MAMLPRFAAMVSSTTSFTSRSVSPIMRNTSMVKGTNVIRVTSLVITMLLRKHNRTITADNARILLALRKRKWPILAKTPLD